MFLDNRRLLHTLQLLGCRLVLDNFVSAGAGAATWVQRVHTDSLQRRGGSTESPSFLANIRLWLCSVSSLFLQHNTAHRRNDLKINQQQNFIPKYVCFQQKKVVLGFIYSLNGLRFVQEPLLAAGRMCNILGKNWWHFIVFVILPSCCNSLKIILLLKRQREGAKSMSGGDNTSRGVKWRVSAELLWQ